MAHRWTRTNISALNLAHVFKKNIFGLLFIPITCVKITSTVQDIMIYVSLWNFNTSQYPFFHWTSWRTETLYINCISVEEGGTVNLRKFRVLHVYIHVQKNINDIREQTSLANIHRIWMKNSRLNGNCRWFVIN